MSALSGPAGFLPLAAFVVALAACYTPRADPLPGTDVSRPDGGAGGRGGGAGVGTGGQLGQVGSPGSDGPVSEFDASSCEPGKHLCAGACVDNRSPMTCGTSCDPCTMVAGAASVGCDGSKCVVTCPPGKKHCFNECIEEASTCNTTCPFGQNPCGGVCIDATSLSACGASCTVCPMALNGKSTCDGESCQLLCDDGFHRCGDACVSNNDVKTCGSSCSACASVDGGEATCDGTKCGGRCPPGKKLCAGACITESMVCGGCPPGRNECNGTCVASNDVNFCGAACRQCKVPANGVAVCNGVDCDFTCKNGFHKCGPDCIANDRQCNGSCINGLKPCGTACVSPATCCTNGKTGCAVCESCDGGVCKPQGDGTQCGNGLVCRSGSCGSCGGNGQPCCPGNNCNSTFACNAGTCAPACVPGGSCGTNPGANNCVNGVFACASATATRHCADGPTKKTSGSCQGGNVCNGAGNCVAACQPGNPCPTNRGRDNCLNGITACASPSANPTCEDNPASKKTSGACQNGARVCNAAGSCVEGCQGGQACNTNPGRDSCLNGITRCSSAAASPTCDDNSNSKKTSGSCQNGGGVCSSNGACVPPCAAGGACATNPGRDNCLNGIFTCSSATASPVCSDNQNSRRTSGTCQGGARVCNASGMCVSPCVPSTEVCDNRDNDCDGAVDENITESCPGECGTNGTRTCTRGTFSACMGAAQRIACYPDVDGDGRGADAPPVMMCNCGGGTVSNKDDCDDNDQRAYKGSTIFGQSPRPQSGSFDFNCDGSITVDPAFRTVQRCNTLCEMVTRPATRDDCGEPSAHACQLGGAGCMSSDSGMTIGCR